MPCELLFSTSQRGSSSSTAFLGLHSLVLISADFLKVGEQFQPTSHIYEGKLIFFSLDDQHVQQTCWQRPVPNTAAHSYLTRAQQTFWKGADSKYLRLCKPSNLCYKSVIGGAEAATDTI